MRVRKLDSDGDMNLGHGDSDFYDSTPEGVAQCVKTRLSLWRGSWFLNIEDGTPWIQSILGKSTAADAVIRARILDTPGVKEITGFESISDPDERSYRFTVRISTIYGDTSLEGTV